MAPFRGVIIDVDGTLVDSNDAHTHAWVDALAENDHQISFEKVRSLVGMGGDNLLPSAIQVEKESELGQRISKRRGEIFKERYLPSLQAFPKAHLLLRRMHAEGLRLVIASSAQADELQALLKIAQVNGLVDGVTSADDAQSSKPDPDIVQAALEKLGYRADECVMLGDTPYDVQSAGKAGVPTIGFRCGGWSEQDLAGALAVYADPADLLAHYEDSPLVRAASVGS